MSANFGVLLKEWRSIRRYSQLELSLVAEISSRHVSFLESGRAKPSREMVVKLAGALDMPKDVANMALHAAGFAPAFPQLDLDDNALAPLRRAITAMITNHAPFPAVAIDRYWDVLEANPAAQSLFATLGVGGATNMIDALIAAGEGDLIGNWEETALLTLARLRTEIVQLGGDRTLERYAGQLSSHPRLGDFNIDDVNFQQAIIPTIFNFAGTRLSMFSTIAGFGAVQDVVASDIRIELMFPTDEQSRLFFEQLLN